MRRGALSLLLAAVLALPATADGAVVIGSNLATPTGGSAFGALGVYVNTAIPAADVAPDGLFAPDSGVVTAWAIRTASGPLNTNTLTPRVVAGNGAVASGITRPLPATEGITSFPERMPIGAGHLFGVELSGPAGVSFRARLAVPSAALSFWGSPFPNGTNRPPIESTGSGVQVQATIEPDADTDGFGDETQDGCLGVGGPRGGCPDPPTAPETQIDSGPDGKIAKTKAKFAFSSPSPGATFECALDQGGFADCSSPKKLKKLANGKHRFRVRAISAEGLLDRSPAEQSFKVKRK